MVAAGLLYWPRLSCMGNSFTELSDLDLAVRCQQTGDRQSFAEIFNRHGKSVFLLCYALVRNRATAEEIAQETFKDALAAFENFRGGSLHAWLARIARNLCLDHLVSAAHRLELAAPELVVDSASAEHFENGILAADEVADVLNELSQPQRICLKLFYVHDFSYSEIAALTGFPEAEVRSHLQNGRRRFKLVWQQREELSRGKEGGSER
jgi:RNA polymerase sigma-70 factor, ECF subfamily